MSVLSKLVRNIAPKVAPIASLIPNPTSKLIGLGAGIIAQDTQKKQIEQAQKEQRSKVMAQYPAGFDPVTGSFRSGLPTTQQAGMGGFFSGVSDFFRGAGEVIGSAFGSGIPQLLGVSRPRGVGQQPAVTSVTNIGAQESSGSGSIQAGFGSLVPSLVSGARSLVQSPLGQLGIGTAVGGALSLLDSTGRQIRITRRTKRLAQQAYQLSMGDLSSATSLFAQLSGISVNEMQFVQILTKRFRNDGPVITKAALRKTKSTLRKMKNMCDMYDSVRKAPARRRASPMKRATTTLIKN